MKSLAKNSIYNMVYKILDLIFPLLASMHVAHTLMPDGVGRVAYSQNIASYFLTAAALGIPVLGIRVISVVRENREQRSRAFCELLILNAVFTTVAILGYSLLVYFNPTFRADYPLYIAAGLTIAFNYLNIDWLYKGFEEYQYIVIRSVIIKILSLVALFLFVKKPEDYVLYALITSLATCGNYVFNVIHARKYVTLTTRGLNLKQHLKPVFMLAASLLFSSVYSKVDVTMLGVMAGEESVGYYSYAHKVLNIAVGICSTVTAAFLPRLSYYYKHDMEKFRGLVAKGLQIVSFLAFPAAIGLFLLAPEAIELMFGAEFLPAAKTLRCFAALILVFAFGNLLCYQMMICSGREKIIAPILGAAALLNVVLNSFLIPSMQQDGAAIASVCTELFINGVEIIYITRVLKLKYDWKVIGQGLFCSIVMGACILVLKQQLSGSLMSFVICVCAGVAVYAATNILVRNQFTMETLSSIKQKICRK